MAMTLNFLRAALADQMRNIPSQPIPCTLAPLRAAKSTAPRQHGSFTFTDPTP